MSLVPMGFGTGPTEKLVFRCFLVGRGHIPHVFGACRNSFFGGLLEDTEPLPPNLFDFSEGSQVFFLGGGFKYTLED